MPASEPQERSEAGDEIAQIVAAGRATRRRTSRGTSIVAAIVGVVCLVGFALLMAGGPDGRAGRGDPAPEEQDASRGGCAGGLGLGLGLGFAAGYGLGQRRRADHSSRSRP